MENESRVKPVSIGNFRFKDTCDEKRFHAAVDNLIEKNDGDPMAFLRNTSDHEFKEEQKRVKKQCAERFAQGLRSGETVCCPKNNCPLAKSDKSN